MEFRIAGANNPESKTSGFPSNGKLPVNTTRPTPTGVRRLPWDEMQKRREQGLCFNCDEKFVPGHKCKVKQAYLIEPIDSSDDEGANDSSHEVDDAEISVHAMADVKGPRTMRIGSWIKGRRVVVLIDNGSSHNFINLRITRKLNIQSTKVDPFFVRVANGEKLHCDTLFKAVPIQVQGVTIRADLFAIPLGGIDIVLGIQWLEELGEVVTDYKAGTMKFRWGDGMATLKSGADDQLKEVGLQSITRMWQKGGRCYALRIEPSATPPKSELSKLHPEISQILTDYAVVLSDTQELPPNRRFDHHIPLKKEGQAINVHPYRYAHFQKEEIERQVKEMLQKGLIRPSTSPFSSPVLLVKKDGSWRFCTDYRALNAATIKDRFPIPTIEDMLDELGGSKFFSKLDLRAGYHQIRVAEADVHKTAFRTHQGHYEYMVMPFGLCNAPSTFQSAMNEIFQVHLRKFVLVFFDDILVYSKSWAEHMQHLREVFSILANHQFHIKISKCAFGRPHNITRRCTG